MSLAITNVSIFDGYRARLLEEAVVITEDNRIAAVGPHQEITIPPKAQLIDGKGLTLMPGLIDAHVHLAYTAAPNRLSRLQLSIPETTVNVVANARQTLLAGFTAVRDAGAPAGTVIGVRNAINSGLIPGPRIMAAGAALTMTGGIGDPQNDFPSEITFRNRRVVDTPQEAVRAAREELRDGADCIKLMATGGVLSLGTDNRSIGMPYEDMAAAIGEARNRGKKTFAHAQATEGIKNAIRAGVDSIEHGFWFDDEAVQLLLDRDSYLVPTLIAVKQILDMGTAAGIPEPAVHKAQIGYEAHTSSLRRIYQAGGKIAMGTDAGTPFNHHGANARELALMVAAGMSTAAVLQTATRNAAELLDIDAGIIAPGKLADLILVDGSPLDDVSCLEDPKNIPLVIKDGRIEKNQLQ